MMLRLIILVTLGYFAWRYYGWHGAAAVIGAYVALSIIWWIWSKASASQARSESERHSAQKLSEAEKLHYAATLEHEQTMREHKARFDPDLRKSRDQ